MVFRIFEVVANKGPLVGSRVGAIWIFVGRLHQFFRIQHGTQVASCKEFLSKGEDSYRGFVFV